MKSSAPAARWRLPRFVLVAFLTLVAVPSPGLAQTPPPDLANLSIDDLMNIRIVSASRKEQRARDAAAAVFVITHDDIRRSGMTTIPDLLRLAPGVEVAQINANKWAVSVRGFNGLYANKLLVLVDGRSIYALLFGGVTWEAWDLMLDDIDRIEVIRGPNAAMWGGNAVNGVINIITKSAADTQGPLVRVDGGRSGEQAAARYGGSRGGARYRLYSQWSHRDESLVAPDVRANDASHSASAGFRLDWKTRPDAFTLEGDFIAGEQRALWVNFDPRTAAGEPFSNAVSMTRGGHALGRWTHTLAGGAALQIQSYADLASRHSPVGDYKRKAFDVDTQFHTAIGAHHHLVVGTAYRFSRERLDGHIGVSLTPAESDSSRVTAFVSDEMSFFATRMAVTLGSQVQHDGVAGAGVQPTARVMWKASSRQRVWAALSRSLRTPSLQQRGIHVEYPPVRSASGLPLIVFFQGTPTAATEELVDVETGYRVEIGTTSSIDVTGFVGHYDHLQTQEIATAVAFVPSPRILVNTSFSNKLKATTRGLEVAGQWSPAPAWRLDGSYTVFHLTPHPYADSMDPTAAMQDGSAPRTKWQLRSAFSPSPRVTLNLSFIHAGRLEQLQVPAYTRADVNAEWRFRDGLSVMAIGQNLFDAAHPEFGGTGSVLQTTQVARSAALRLRWAFGR